MTNPVPSPREECPAGKGGLWPPGPPLPGQATPPASGQRPQPPTRVAVYGRPAKPPSPTGVAASLQMQGPLQGPFWAPLCWGSLRGTSPSIFPEEQVERQNGMPDGHVAGGMLFVSPTAFPPGMPCGRARACRQAFRIHRYTSKANLPLNLSFYLLSAILKLF